MLKEERRIDWRSSEGRVRKDVGGFEGFVSDSMVLRFDG